jgi:hypothetical protein
MTPGAFNEAGVAIRRVVCPKHNRVFQQTLFPGAKEWIGRCDLCPEPKPEENVEKANTGETRKCRERNGLLDRVKARG